MATQLFYDEILTSVNGHNTLEYGESGTSTSAVTFVNRKLWIELVAPLGA